MTHYCLGLLPLPAWFLEITHDPRGDSPRPSSFCERPGSQSFLGVPGNCLFHHDWRCSGNYPIDHPSRVLLVYLNWQSILFSPWVPSAREKDLWVPLGPSCNLGSPWHWPSPFCIWHKWNMVIKILRERAKQNLWQKYKVQTEGCSFK